MPKHFYKYQGSGNDFILFEDYDRSFPIQSSLISHICNRKLGIGGDGILLLQSSNLADVTMRIFNQDGTEASMCGNGLRCVVKHIATSCSIETKAGISFGEYLNPSIKISFPKSELIQSHVALPYNLTGHLVNTGTPHLVIFTDDINSHDIAKNLRYHPMFGKGGVNVNIAQIISEGIQVRTFEKGVEHETLSCGTGGAAVAYLHKKNVTIFFTSSSIPFSFDSKDRIWMEGTAEQVFQGTLCLKNPQ